jgi:protein-S-isoprenylcysteine O-methyltransferase Ste14
MLAAFAIRRSAIAALGRYWSVHVEIREGHELIRTGPFRWVRHPTYFSMLLELLAVMLILQATVTLCVMPFLFLPALAWRLHLEEPALIAKFGDAYRDYMRDTPCFLPFKWRRSR